jgi:hypothetical protein
MRHLWRPMTYPSTLLAHAIPDRARLYRAAVRLRGCHPELVASGAMRRTRSNESLA